MVGKWIKFDKYWYGFGGHVTFFNKVSFYAGIKDSWGIGVDFSFYDRSITFDILNLYFGVEVWYTNSDIIDFVRRTKGDMLD
jgi:hypothetical protein